MEKLSKVLDELVTEELLLMHISRFLMVGLSLLLCLSNAKAETKIYRSATWLMTGTCNSTDQVYEWTVEGYTKPGTWNIPPWSADPFVIRGVELTKYDGGPIRRWPNDLVDGWQQHNRRHDDIPRTG
jgi:hypothetical protein